LLEIIVKAWALLYVAAAWLGELVHVTTFETMNIFWFAGITIWFWAVVSLSLILVFRMIILISRVARQFFHAN